MSVATSTSSKISDHTSHIEAPTTTSAKEDTNAVKGTPLEKAELKASEDTAESTPSNADGSSSAEQEAKDGSEDAEGATEDIIDMEIFKQILDLDEDDTLDFSKEMVTEYFVQATSTFTDMDGALQDKNLEKLSSLGHFLKGSSATLGVSAVQSSCEKIQNYGKKQDESGDTVSDGVALDKISNLIKQVKKDYRVAETWLTQWYKDRGAELS